MNGAGQVNTLIKPTLDTYGAKQLVLLNEKNQKIQWNEKKGKRGR